MPVALTAFLFLVAGCVLFLAVVLGLFRQAAKRAGLGHIAESDERRYQPHGMMDVVGESFYLPALQSQRARMIDRGDDPNDLWFDATLVPEPENRDDPNAVAVKNEDNETIGHLRREVARQYQEKLTRLASSPWLKGAIRA